MTATIKRMQRLAYYYGQVAKVTNESAYVVWTGYGRTWLNHLSFTWSARMKSRLNAHLYDNLYMCGRFKCQRVISKAKDQRL